jgi:preprotein translocase subunit SecY
MFDLFIIVLVLYLLFFNTATGAMFLGFLMIGSPVVGVCTAIWYFFDVNVVPFLLICSLIFYIGFLVFYVNHMKEQVKIYPDQNHKEVVKAKGSIAIFLISSTVVPLFGVFAFLQK